MPIENAMNVLIKSIALILLAGCVSLLNFEGAIADDSLVTSPVDFNRDLLPILAKNCTACHNTKKKEGGLDLSSYTAAMEGSDSGDSIVPGDHTMSYLWERVVSDEEPMPPEENQVDAKPFSAGEAELLKTWIGDGALAPEKESTKLVFKSLPTNLHPTYAMASSPDGLYLAASRGNQAFVIENNTSDLVETDALVDANLPHTHLDLVQSIAFSPDSQRIATGGFRTVKIWKRSTDSELVLSKLPVGVTTSCFSDDANWLACVTDDHIVELIHIETGRIHKLLRTHTAPITAITWLSDNRRLLSCDTDGRIVLIDSASFQETVLRSEVADGAPHLVQTVLAADGQVLALDSSGTLSKLALDPFELHPLPDVQGVSALASFADDAKVFVSLEDASIGSVNLATGKFSPLIASGDVAKERKENSLFALRLSQDGKTLAVLPNKGIASLWRTSDGSKVADLNLDYSIVNLTLAQQRDADRQSKRIELLSAKIPGLEAASKKEVEAKTKLEEARKKAADALANQETEVEKATQQVKNSNEALAAANAAIEEAKKQAEKANADLDAKKKLLAAANKKKSDATNELAKRDQALAAASDSARRAAEAIPALNSTIDGEKDLLSKLTKKLEKTKSLGAALKPVEALSFSTDGTLAFVGRSDSNPQLISTEDGSPVASLVGSSPTINAAVCSDRRALALDGKGRLVSWDMNLSWQLERTIGGINSSFISDRVTALDFNPDGTLLAIGSGPPSQYGDLKLINVSDGNLGNDFGQVHSDTIFGVRFSPDGRQLATVGADKICRVLSSETGQLLKTLEGHTHHVLGVDWRDDGQALVTSGADSVVKVWDTDTGQQTRTISGFAKEVSSVSFVGTTTQVVSASIDGKARLHDTATGKLVREFSTSSAVYTLAISQTGTQVAAGGDSGILYNWKLSDGKLGWTLPKQD